MKWLERTWTFDGLEGRYAEMLDALSSTPGKLSTIVVECDETILKMSLDHKWSICEHIGHLLTMESLWIARLDDFVLGRQTLRPWNGTNEDTEMARFNEQRTAKLLADFSDIRAVHAQMLFGLKGKEETMRAWHERLGKTFRLLDHVHFMLEHDLHHLKTIEQIINQTE